jgi:hypothetical protein
MMSWDLTFDSPCTLGVCTHRALAFSSTHSCWCSWGNRPCSVRCICEALLNWLWRLMSLLSWCFMTHPIVQSCIIILESHYMSLTPLFSRHCIHIWFSQSFLSLVICLSLMQSGHPLQAMGDYPELTAVGLYVSADSSSHHYHGDFCCVLFRCNHWDPQCT